MSKVARAFSSGLAVACLLPVVVFLAAGQGPPATGVSPRGRTARAADLVLKEGLEAKIPPHVSDMLGISADGKECPVAQRYERKGKLVRGFEVSLTDKNNIVIFVTDEAANEQTYYLTSGRGELRRMLAVREGIGHVLRVTGKDKAAFRRDLQFWLARIVPGTSK